MKILSLNCQKGYNPHLHRFLRETLESRHYDFLVLQEATPNVIDMVAGNSAYRHVVGFNDEVRQPAHLCIVYRHAFTLAEKQLFTFAHIAPHVRLKHPGYGLFVGTFLHAGSRICVGSVHLNAGLHPAVRKTELRRIEIKERMLEHTKHADVAVFGGDFNFGFPQELAEGAHILLPDFVCVTKNIGPTLDSRYTEYLPSIPNVASRIMRMFGLGIALRADHFFVDRDALEVFRITARRLRNRVSDHSPVELALEM